MRMTCNLGWAAFALASLLPMGSAATADTHYVDITDSGFIPQSLVITPGDTVVWNFTDSIWGSVVSGTDCTADYAFIPEPTNCPKCPPSGFTWTAPEYGALELPYFGNQCQAGLITIDVGGATHTVPSDFATIAEAIGEAQDGDTIDIAAGTYTEHDLVLAGKQLRLRGATHADGSPAVTIDAQQQGRGIWVYTRLIPAPAVTGQAVLENLIITGGVGDGAGLFIQHASPLLRNCHITGNASDGNGGGIWVSGRESGTPAMAASPNLVRCTIEDNEATHGGGLYSSLGYDEGVCEPTLASCVVTSNTSTTAGVHADAGTTTITWNTIICGNAGDQVLGSVTLSGSCEAAYCLDDDDDGVPDGCLFDQDGVLHVPEEFATITAAVTKALDGQSVVIAAGTYDAVPFENNGLPTIFIYNKSIAVIGEVNADGSPAVTITGDPAGGVDGTGIYIGPGADGTSIENIRVAYATGGLLIDGCEATVDNCIIEHSFNYYGGGAAFSNAQATLTNCVFRQNAAYSGGGIAQVENGGDVTLVDCLIEQNTVLWYGVGGAHVLGGTVTMVDCTVRDNQGYAVGSAFAEDGGLLVVEQSTVCGNLPANDIGGDWTDGGGNTIEDVCPEPCAGDLDGTGEVTVDDLLSLLGFWGDGNAGGDVNDDGNTNVDDLLLLIGSWGPCNA